MKESTGSSLGSGFTPTGSTWAPLDAERTAQLVAATSDLALLVDDGGVIRNITISSSDPPWV